MSVRYLVKCSDELMATPDLQWPATLRPVREMPGDPFRRINAHWWEFEDDEAPASLAGKPVELIITRGRESEDGPFKFSIERQVLG